MLNRIAFPQAEHICTWRRNGELQNCAVRLSGQKLAHPFLVLYGEDLQLHPIGNVVHSDDDQTTAFALRLEEARTHVTCASTCSPGYRVRKDTVTITINGPHRSLRTPISGQNVRTFRNRARNCQASKYVLRHCQRSRRHDAGILCPRVGRGLMTTRQRRSAASQQVRTNYRSPASSCVTVIGC